MGGKVCAIIGFGPGLGTAYAATFSQAGYDLGLLSRSGACFGVAESLESSVRAYQSDAGNPDSIKVSYSPIVGQDLA
jgi:short-subunit dehydrogenase